MMNTAFAKVDAFQDHIDDLRGDIQGQDGIERQQKAVEGDSRKEDDGRIDQEEQLPHRHAGEEMMGDPRCQVGASRGRARPEDQDPRARVP